MADPGSADPGSTTRVGLVGTGRMGRPLLRRLIEAGHEVTALGRTAAARAALAADGARAVTRLADVGAEAAAVLICVFTDEQVRDVGLGGELLAGMPSGSAVVVHTTGSPDTVGAMAASAAVRGIGVLDAPVSGGPHDVAAGRVTLFVGGPGDIFARVRPVLASYGHPVLHVGPLGAGQRVKLVNNVLFAAQAGLLADAIRLGGQLGVDEAVLLRALPHGSAASRALDGAAGRGSVAAFTAAVGEFLGKDLAVARRVAGDLGVGPGTSRLLDQRG